MSNEKQIDIHFELPKLQAVGSRPISRSNVISYKRAAYLNR